MMRTTFGRDCASAAAAVRTARTAILRIAPNISLTASMLAAVRFPSHLHPMTNLLRAVAPLVAIAALPARADARGKIVLFNAPFDTTVNPFVGYGQAVQYRAYGVDSAAARGAVAVLVRSVTPRSLRSPHTGALSYTDTTRRVPRIPAAAVTIEDAELLQ